MTNETELKPVTNTPKVSCSWLSTPAFLTVAALALLVSSIYVTLSNHQEKSRQALAAKTLQDSIATLTQQLHQENKLIKHQQKTLRQQIHDLTNRLETSPTATNPPTEPLWKLKKARDYLALAQINMSWGNDQSSRLDLLSAANRLLANNADERLISINQMIELAITKLNAAPPVNTNQLINSLETLQATLNTLPLKQNPTPQTPRSNASNSSWQSHLQNSLQQLQQLIIVRHHSQDEPSRSSIQERLFRYEVLTMDILQAKWAVLQKDTALYQQSLTHLIQILQTTNRLNPLNNPPAIPENEPLQALLSQLEILKQAPLTSEKPDLMPALTALDELINSNE